MPKCEILQDFMGSQDGRYSEAFQAGTVVDISQYLFEYAPKGSLRLVNQAEQPEVENKATITTTTRKLKK